MPDESTPPETGKRRAPQKKMSADDRARLLEILKLPSARVNGKIDAPAVAALTGLSYQQVIAVIRKDRYLHAQVAEANPDSVATSEADAMDAPAHAAPGGMFISNEDFERAQALFRQQKKLDKEDWVGLGMDEKMAEQAARLGKIGRAPLLGTMNVVGGGLIRGLMMLQQILEDDGEKIRLSSLPHEVDKEGLPVEDGKKQREWRYCWLAGYKTLIDLQKSLHQNQAILAKAVRDMKLAGEGGPKKPEKGVYEIDPPEKTA